MDEEDFRALLMKIDTEASKHGGDYSAGMREARRIFEEELSEQDLI